MAQGTNVELVRSVFDLFLRGDQAAMFELISPEVVVTQFSDQLDTRAFHGHDGVREAISDWIGAWDEWAIELTRASEIGAHVVAIALQRVRGKVSGAPIESEVVFVFTIRDAAIVRWQMFHSEAEALQALGLEQG
jgi:ketosteroid isomerase-like protein